MKTLLIIFLMIGMASICSAQNAPFGLWGNGLDGSMLQMTSLYSDINNGFLIDVAKKADGSKLPFSINWRGGGTPPFRIDPAGNISIGTADAQGYKLAVNGNMIAESVKVKLQSAWPDYVFTPGYSLKPLVDLEKFIHANKHLPEMPSAKTVEKNGISLGEMDAKLLKKIEELTLYVIELKKEIEALKGVKK